MHDKFLEKHQQIRYEPKDWLGLEWLNELGSWNNKSVNAGVKLFVNCSSLPTIGLLFDGI
jgi:hypothetical protein